MNIGICPHCKKNVDIDLDYLNNFDEIDLNEGNHQERAVECPNCKKYIWVNINIDVNLSIGGKAPEPKPLKTFTMDDFNKFFGGQ